MGRNQNCGNERRTLSFCALLSSSASHSEFHFLLLYFFYPHIWYPTAGRKRRSKCHVGNEGGGLLFVPGEALCTQAGACMDRDRLTETHVGQCSSRYDEPDISFVAPAPTGGSVSDVCHLFDKTTSRKGQRSTTALQNYT